MALAVAVARTAAKLDADNAYQQGWRVYGVKWLEFALLAVGAVVGAYCGIGLLSRRLLFMGCQ